MEVQSVSQILSRTSASLAVSNRLPGLVAKNIPISGARIKSSTNAPRRRKLGWRRDLLVFWNIFGDGQFVIIGYRLKVIGYWLSVRCILIIS